MVSGRNKLFLALREHWKPQNIKKDLPEYGETAIKINGKRKPHTCRGESPNPALFYYTHVRESKTVSLGFWITRHGFQALDSGFFDSETWIPDLNHKWDSGFLELYSGFQSPGFRIPRAKTSPIPDSTVEDFPDSKDRAPLHGAKMYHHKFRSMQKFWFGQKKIKGLWVLWLIHWIVKQRYPRGNVNMKNEFE